ncbi:unnamed protein product [Urochloa decumbens]|uniref:Uncharacterized protein n=1 Tax=Urochloa decumbens TaxID=240449 RepID=A0ABC8X1H7_9POAL
MAKLTALTIVVLVAMAAATTIVSFAHGARTLEAVEHVAIPASFVATPPAVDDVDFSVPLEEAAADGPAAAGPNASDWDDKTPVSGQ